MKVSIIIPVYNRERLIVRCLESVVNQTHKNLEIIIVNDGSTDNTLNTLKAYKKKHKSIKIIDKKNEGVACARADGLEVAKGKYIAFVDSDDYLDLDYIEKMLNTMILTNTNIACARFVMELSSLKFINLKSRHKPIIMDFSKNKELLFLIDVRSTGKLYKREFVELTDKNFRANEDLSITHLNFARANDVSYNKNALYHFVSTKGSLSKTEILGYKYENIENTLLPLEELKNNFIKYNLYDSYFDELEIIFIKNISQRIQVISISVMNSKKQKLLIQYLLCFLINHFPNWENNKYYKNISKIFEINEIAYILQAKGLMKKYLPDFKIKSTKKILKKYKDLLEEK